MTNHLNRGNAIFLDAQTCVEWKFPNRTMAEAEASEVGGFKVRTSDEYPDWVRIRRSLPDAPQSVVGFRLFLKLTSNKDRMSIKVGAVTGTGSSGIREVFSIKPFRANLRAGTWYEIKGALIVVKSLVNRQLSVVVDLPRGAEVELVGVSTEEFPFKDARAAENDVQESDEVLGVGDQPFGVVEVVDIADALAAPPVFAHDMHLTGDRVIGWAMTKASGLVASTGHPGQGGIALMVDGPAQLDQIVVDGIAIEAALEGPFATSQLLMLHAKEGTRQILARLQREGGNTLKAPAKARFPRDRQNNVVLLWAPISTAGLTVQLEQVAHILKENKFDFQISYHMKPRVDHPLVKHWVDPRDIDSPKLVIYFERFVEFDRGFDAAFKVFYLNLDWLSNKTLAAARTHANLVLCPTPYLLDELSEEFRNSKVVYLPWPAQIAPKEMSSEATAGTNQPIRVLYVGNDYDEISRKHPFAVVEAVGKLQRDDLIVDLKFRTALPEEVRARLAANPCVGEIVDWSADYDVVEQMYDRADVNLIPNACEGNGLSILESWASGTVPAVLDGHPMKDVTSDDNSFRLACVQTGDQERAPYYKTSPEQIFDFLQNLTREALNERIEGVQAMRSVLQEREDDLKRCITSCVMMSGLRTRGLRDRIENVHLPSGPYKSMKPRGGDRVRDLMFKDEGQAKFVRKPRLIDVLLTTSRRPWCLSRALQQLTEAMRASPYEHRLFVAVDQIEASTTALLQQYSYAIEQVLWTNSQMGLPYTWNALNELQQATVRRSELRPDYICYIQDDCELNDPATYFETMGSVAHAAMPGYLGFVSGFYTEVHPGFADFDWKGHRMIATDSIDGKNFMGTPEVISSIGPLTWQFSDGMRRGNPGPVRGSHFDLWQWKESTNSLLQQKRISLLLPDLCRHSAQSAAQSTWNNDTTDSSTAKRIAADRVYKTRSYEDR